MARVQKLPDHLYRLEDNAAEVERLTEIHREISGDRPGRKRGVDVLNKSGIVLLVACWEDFIEDLACSTFDAIFEKARKPSVFPNKALALAGRSVRNTSNELDVWNLAGKGWKDVVSSHREDILKRYVGRFNTPKPEFIDPLFEQMVGLKNLSGYWSWSGMSSEGASKKLVKLVKLRGEIAHKVATEESVTKAQLTDYTHFIKRLAAISSNQTGLFVARRVRKRPWPVNLVYVGHRNNNES